MTSGLLTCKLKNAPKPGQTKNLIWVTKVSESSGNEYIKVNYKKVEEGGKPCQIISAEQTDFTDSHGNVSFNVEFQPVDGNGVPTIPQDRQNATQTSGDAPVQRPVEDWRQHLAKAAFLLQKCHAAATAYGMEDGEDARSLFIWATREGLVSQMPQINLKTGGGAIQ